MFCPLGSWNATSFRCPAGRYAAPEEIAGTAVFLASQASDFVSGQLIFVDGGVTANMM
jgi:gluconate 5-dehydrogenase